MELFERERAILVNSILLYFVTLLDKLNDGNHYTLYKEIKSLKSKCLVGRKTMCGKFTLTLVLATMILVFLDFYDLNLIYLLIILILGDRHNDNIMIKNDGKV